jgi:hypothetical protein
MSPGVTTVLKLCELVRTYSDMEVRLLVPVCLCDFPALVCFAANDHDRLVLEMVHVGKGSVALDEHGRVQRHIEPTAQVGDALRLVFPAAIGEQDEWNTLRLEIGEGLVSARQWISTPKKHSVDTDSRQRPCCESDGRAALLESECKVGCARVGGSSRLEKATKRGMVPAASDWPRHAHHICSSHGFGVVWLTVLGTMWVEHTMSSADPTLILGAVYACFMLLRFTTFAAKLWRDLSLRTIVVDF